MKQLFRFLLVGALLLPCVPSQATWHKRHRSYARKPPAPPLEEGALESAYKQQVADQLKFISAGSDQIVQLSDGASDWEDQYRSQKSEYEKELYKVLVKGADGTATAKLMDEALAALGTPVNAYQMQQWHLQMTDCKAHCEALRNINPVPQKMKTIDGHLDLAATQMEQAIAAYDVFLGGQPFSPDDLKAARKLHKQALDSLANAETEFAAIPAVQKVYD